jgi:uncharacterized cupredoxin-like copper-binding protein
VYDGGRPAEPARVRHVRLIASLLAVAVAAALAGCGEDRESGTGTSTNGKTGTETAATPKGKPVKTVAIGESEFKLSPKQVSVDKPGVYEFEAKNTGNTVHALELEGQGTEVETKEIQPGKSATLKAELKGGEYKLYCPVGNHEQQGMTGTVTVGGKAGGGGTGTSTSEDSGSGGAAAPGY